MRTRRDASAVRVSVLAFVVAFSLGAGTGVTFAAFTGPASSPGPTVTTKRIFSGSRTTPAWSVSDHAGNGAAVDSSAALAFSDTRTAVTASAWAAAFSAARYLEFTMNSALPGGVPVSAAFNFSFASTGAGTACYYFDVRHPSTGAVLATHGSPGTPIGCTTSAGASFTTALPELTSSDVVNGARVRVYQTQSSLTTTATNVATVSATAYSSVVMYPASSTDASSGTAGAASPWSLAVADAAAYQTVGNWPNSFDATRYVDFAFPAYVPAGAALTAASFTHTYKDVNNSSQCYYIDVFVAGSVIATHGSSGTPYCAVGAAFATDVIALPEINTVARANGVLVRMYGWNQGGTKRSLEDAALLSVTYSLD